MRFNPNGSVKTITDETVAVSQAYAGVFQKASHLIAPVQPGGAPQVQAHAFYLRAADVPEVVSALEEAESHLAAAVAAYDRARAIILGRRTEWVTEVKEQHMAAIDKLSNKQFAAWCATLK